MSRSESRVVLVTGGSSGIGLAAATEFVSAGDTVVVTGRNETTLKAASERHVGMTYRVADMEDPEQIATLAEWMKERFGALHVLVNNAGRFSLGGVGELEADVIDAIFRTNVAGPLLLVRNCLELLEKTRGAIINVSSTFGRKPAPGAIVYGASKAALEHLTTSLALDLAPRGIRVNSVAPGPTDTGILAKSGLSDAEIAASNAEMEKTVPIGRRGSPDEVARWIRHLAGRDADWVTGTVVRVDGGLFL